MRIEHFRFLFSRELDVFYLTEDIRIFKKPFSIWNEKTGESVNFKTLDEVLEHKIDGVPVKEIVLNLEKPLTPELEGGRGAGSGSNKTFSFNHASGGGGGNDKALPPAIANTKIKL